MGAYQFNRFLSVGIIHDGLEFTRHHIAGGNVRCTVDDPLEATDGSSDTDNNNKQNSKHCETEYIESNLFLGFSSIGTDFLALFFIILFTIIHY